MRRAYTFLIISSFICSVASGQNASMSTAPILKTEKCSVAGMVVRKGTNEPIRFARVTLGVNEGQEERTLQKLHALTGADGKFAIKDITPGKYLMMVARNGYVSESYGARHPIEPGLQLNLTPGKQMDDLIFRMIPAAVITGHVRDENGEPLAGAQVSALLSSFWGGKHVLFPANVAEVNDLGEYRLFNLSPGKYLLSAGYQTNSMRGNTVGAFGNPEQHEGLVTTYYPGTTNPSQAASLNVDAGAEIHSIDFSFRPSGVYHIRGRVLGIKPESSGFGGVVMLRNGNGRQTLSMPEKNAQVGAGGTFDIEEVACGSYEIFAMTFGEGERRIAHQSVDVGTADLNTVELSFEPTVTITGHLRWEDKAAAPNVPLAVSLRQEEPFLIGNPAVDVRQDGSFELKDVSADTYWVNVTGPAPDAYLKSAQYGSSDALGNLRVNSSSGATLELVVSSRGARIQGVVMNSDPVPVSGAWVTLIPGDSNRNQKRLYQSVRSGANGKFEFRGVAPGSYSLFSWDNVEEHEWDDPEFLKPFKSKDFPIRVAEGETKTADLTVIRTKSDEEAKP